MPEKCGNSHICIIEMLKVNKVYHYQGTTPPQISYSSWVINHECKFMKAHKTIAMQWFVTVTKQKFFSHPRGIKLSCRTKKSKKNNSTFYSKF